VEEQVVALFEEAISRSLRPWTPEKKSRVIEKVKQTMTLLKEGRITAEDAFYQLLGIAYDYIVPISPGDEARLRKLLGL